MNVRKPNSAYLLITCNEGKIEDVLTDSEGLNEIKEIQQTVGAYDLIAKIESATQEFLDRFLLEKIRTMPNIRSVMMLRCNEDLQYAESRTHQ